MILIHLDLWGVGKKPTNHKLRWVKIHPGFVGILRYLLWEEEISVLWWKATGMSLGVLRGSLMVYDPFAAASDIDRPGCECDSPLEEESGMCEGGQFGMIKDTILSPQGLPLINLKTWFAATRQ